MLTRRQLFKRTGVVLAILPFLSMPTAAEAVEVDAYKLTPELVKKSFQYKPNTSEWKQIPVYPRITVRPPSPPSVQDPLGEYGVIAIKYRVGDLHYGDWIKVSSSDGSAEETLKYAKEMLIEHSQRKLSRINPQAYLVV